MPQEEPRGAQSSEYWTGILGALATVGVAFTGESEAVKIAIISAITLLAISYTWSRTRVKQSLNGK